MAQMYDIAVDFMDLAQDGRLWARQADVRPGFTPAPGRFAIVGDEDADPRIARIEAIEPDGNLALQVLPGAADLHQHLLTPA
ncbi:MAG: hypothetical protein ACT4PP_06690 [Sporichthyaceae bacterium]